MLLFALETGRFLRRCAPKMPLALLGELADVSLTEGGFIYPLFQRGTAALEAKGIFEKTAKQ